MESDRCIVKEDEKQEWKKELLRKFGSLIYRPHKHSLGMEFRFPNVNEEVLINHGFFRLGIGRVIAVNPESKDEKILVAVQGNESVFEVPYTYDKQQEYWNCVKGESQIGSGAVIAIYTGQDMEINLDKFVFIYPPTQEAREYHSEIKVVA